MKAKSFLFALLLVLTSNAFAEYYLVYTPDGCVVKRCYRRCSNGCTVYINSRAPYRHHHNSYGLEQVEEYRWIDP